MADGWFDELLRELFAPAPVQVVQVPTLPKKEEGEPIRTDGKLVLEHPLTVADLGDGARTAPGERELLAGAQLVHHPSAGSLYLNFYYDLGNVKPEDMPYLDLLTDVLDELDSTEHTAQQLNTLRSMAGRQPHPAGHLDWAAGGCTLPCQAEPVPEPAGTQSGKGCGAGRRMAV